MKYKKVLLPPERITAAGLQDIRTEKLPLNRDSGGMVHMKFPI